MLIKRRYQTSSAEAAGTLSLLSLNDKIPQVLQLEIKCYCVDGMLEEIKGGWFRLFEVGLDEVLIHSQQQKST